MAFSDVLLHFPELLVTDNRVGVFLTIDNALLQAVEGFRPGERIGFDAPGTEGGELQLNGGHADLQALEVGHLGDGMLGVGDMAVTGAQPAEGTGAALLGNKFVHLLHENIIGEDLGVLVETGETIGKIEDAGRGGERSQVAAGEDSHVDFSRTQLLHIGLLVAHGATDELLNLNLAARFLLDDFLELIDGDNMLAAIRVGRGRADGHSLVLDSAGGNRTAENQSQSTHQSNDTFHTFLLGKKFGIKTNKQNNNISGNNLDDNSDEDDSSSPSSNTKTSKGDRNGTNGLGNGSYDLEQNETSLQSSNDDSQEKFWKDVSEHIQQDLESFSKMQGMGAANMIQNLKEVNREKYDYTSFLKKFAVMGEAMKINDDEFDYVFYTYGLNRYGNMPLIEPLEYKDVKRIKEFVIAIDTSGSVSGKLVQTFLNKTYNILMSNESFFSKINIHIIQCDADIQEDKKITKREEFENYLKNMKLRGFGGTDFRPVFEYVDNLIKNREFINLKGLIYFTDGYGTFPKEMPDYKTAFIFIDEGYDQPEIPSWAIRLVLQKGDI